jgi:hypothetical protein
MSQETVPWFMALSNQAVAIFWTTYWPAQARRDDRPLTSEPSCISLLMHESTSIAIRDLPSGSNQH